jgi:hypothetical protein
MAPKVHLMHFTNTSGSEYQKSCTKHRLHRHPGEQTERNSAPSALPVGRATEANPRSRSWTVAGWFSL